MHLLIGAPGTPTARALVAAGRPLRAVAVDDGAA